MNEVERVVKYIGSCRDAGIDCTVTIDKSRTHLILNALRKRIPMKIKEVHVDEYFCPACGSENNCNDRIVTDKFCPECGQAFDLPEEY